MGDRGNIVLCDESWTAKLYLYTHWSGSDLPQIVATALTKFKERWDDRPYLQRGLFQTLVGDDSGVIGFGLDWDEGDGGTEVYVNADKQLARYDYSFDEFADKFKT